MYSFNKGSHGSFTIGTDTEFFLSKNNKYVASQPYIKGTKYKPQQLRCGGTLCRDNVAAEFATPPVSGYVNFYDSIKNCIKDTKSVITGIDSDIKFNLSPSVIFDEDQLNHPEAHEFACEPDFNAWTGKINSAPNINQIGGLRSAATHLHFGYLNGSNLTFLLSDLGRMGFIKMLDLIVAIPSVILDDTPESIERRKLYGKAGCFRPTPYGVEYRTLSNFVIKSPKMLNLIYSLVRFSIKLMIELTQPVILTEFIGPELIQSTINTGNVEQAKHILIEMRKILCDNFGYKQNCVDFVNLNLICLGKYQNITHNNNNWEDNWR